jgi:tRNA G26 N,N-dimethylase Trm1
MTSVQTLRDPKAKRLIDDHAPQNRTESDEQETPLEWFRRWCCECDERRKREGPLYEDPPLSMEEIVAICKEARAERYAEKQKDSTCR